MSRLSPAEHRARFGPSAGDRIRLGDTDLWIRVEEDRQALGDEPIWGYAKDIRLGHGPVGAGRPVASSTRWSSAPSSSTR